MSKIGELSQVLDTLVVCGNDMIECGKELIRTVNALRGMFSGEQEQADAVKEVPPRPEPVKTDGPVQETKKFSFVDVRKAFSAKSHAGYTEQVRALIGKYGADKLSAVKEEDYEALMTDLGAIG